MSGLTLIEAHKELSSFAEMTSEGVYHCRSYGAQVGDATLEALRTIAEQSARGKARLCMHPSPEENEQQMLVAISRSCWDAVHFHPEKAETLIWVEGTGRHCSHSENGGNPKKTQLGPSSFGYVHTRAGVPHHVIVESDILIFWEFALGPFGPDSTIFTDAPRSRSCA